MLPLAIYYGGLHGRNRAAGTIGALWSRRGPQTRGQLTRSICRRRMAIQVLERSADVLKCLKLKHIMGFETTG